MCCMRLTNDAAAIAKCTRFSLRITAVQQINVINFGAQMYLCVLKLAAFAGW